MKIIAYNHPICHFYCDFSVFYFGTFRKYYKISQLIRYTLSMN